MRPALLADAALGDRIRFRLPADLDGGHSTHEGVLWAYEARPHVTGRVIAFRISGDCAREFTCRPDLNIDLERTTR